MKAIELLKDIIIHANTQATQSINEIAKQALADLEKPCDCVDKKTYCPSCGRKIKEVKK
jgi:hypothetical protein